MKKLICLTTMAMMVFAFTPAIYADDVQPPGSEATGPSGNGNVFAPYFNANGPTKTYKDTNSSKITDIIRAADFGSGGEKWKLIAKTFKGSTYSIVFTGKGGGTTGCTKKTKFNNYVEMKANGKDYGEYFKLVKVKRIKGSGSRIIYLYMNTTGAGDAGWKRTSGASWPDSCSW